MMVCATLLNLATMTLFDSCRFASNKAYALTPVNEHIYTHDDQMIHQYANYALYNANAPHVMLCETEGVLAM